MDLCHRTVKPVEQVVKKEDVSDIVLVGGSTRIPNVRRLIKGYFGKESLKGINPDEAVEDVFLIDVCPLTMGIETTGGFFAKPIPRDTDVPTKKSRIFLTAAENQPTALIQVCLRGERSLTNDNDKLCKFELSGIRPAQSGVPHIEATFEVDADGRYLERWCHGKSESITITNEKGRLGQEEIDRMVHEADEFASEDEAQHKRIEALNDLQNLCLGDQEGLGDKIADEDKKTTLAAAKETTDWIEENGQSATSENLEEKLQEVQPVVDPITGELYRNGPGSGPRLIP
ncbi:ATPase with role in protein import into the ER [Ceratobasidium sp. 394]|nr:ATPase with role in protein import into the ER [Ceratobasidium sp. 394]